MKADSGVAFVANAGGHRESYVETLATVTGLSPMIGGGKISRYRKLIAAKNLLFVSMEDDVKLFLIVTVIRTFIGRPTTAIVMNPARVLEGAGLQHTFKGYVLKILRSFKKVNTLSIIPFYLDERLEKLTDNWIYDPQFWDLELQAEDIVPSALSEQVKTQADGRKILLYLGFATTIKGFDFLVDCMEQHPQICSHFLVVAAGRMDSMSPDVVERFNLTGGVMINRYLTDHEVISLKMESNCIWACYSPGYNSSSGMFGRAMQLQKHVIVREGSILEKIGNTIGYPVLSCEYANTRSVAKSLEKLIYGTATTPITNIGQHCRDLSIDRLTEYTSV